MDDTDKEQEARLAALNTEHQKSANPEERLEARLEELNTRHDADIHPDVET